MISWEKANPRLPRTGELWDLVVSETELADWERVVDAAIRDDRFTCEYFVDGTPAAFRSTKATFEQDRPVSPLLKVWLGKVSFNTHFVRTGEIEFDVSPREVTTEAELQTVARFMRFLSDRTSKDVLLTPESIHDCPVLAYSRGNGDFEYFDYTESKPDRSIEEILKALRGKDET